MESINRRGFGRKLAGLAAGTLTAPFALAQAGDTNPADEAAGPKSKKKASKEIICAFGTDIDSVAGQIGSYAGGDSPSDIQRGIFAGEVGTIRLLNLFKKYKLKTSFFIPGHSIETFPEPMKRIADEGHEIGAHGYLHENPIAMTPVQEEAVLVKSIDVIEKLSGQKPRGYVAPWWEMSASTAALLQKYGFQYDHSQGYRDFQPFYARVGDSWNVIDYAKKAEEWMKPLVHGKEIDLVEIGANWYLDDLPPMMFMKKVPNSHGFVNPRDIEQMWRDQFDWVYRELDYGVFPFTIHPGVSGRPQVILMLERLIGFCCNFGAATSGWTVFGKNRTGSDIMPSDNPFKWRQFEPALILRCVRWYLRYALSYRDLEDMMRERGLRVDHTTIYRWVQRYAPEIDRRCRPFLRRTNDSYRIDETYVRVGGAWKYLYRGVDSNGDTLDFLLRATRDREAAIAFFRKTLGAAHTTPPRVVTVDKNPAYPVAFNAVQHEGLIRPRSNLRQCKYLNNVVEQDHRFIKRRTRPMLGFKRFTTAWRTLRGIEIMHALRKGQARWMAKGNVVGQAQLIHHVFGVAA